MSLTIRWQDVSGMVRLSNALGRLSSHEKHLALQRAVNHTGDKARTEKKGIFGEAPDMSGLPPAPPETGPAPEAPASILDGNDGALSPPPPVDQPAPVE